MEEFDIDIELELAANIPFTELEMPLVWSFGLVGFDDGEGGTSIPTVWQMQEGSFVSGYQTEQAICVLFINHPIETLSDAKEFAIRVTGLAHATGPTTDS
jgi:hypothetical protein